MDKQIKKEIASIFSNLSFKTLNSNQGVTVYIKSEQPKASLGVLVVKNPKKAFPAVKVGVIDEKIMENFIDIPAIKKLGPVLLTSSTNVISEKDLSDLEMSNDSAKFLGLLEVELREFVSKEEAILHDFHHSMNNLVLPQMYSENNQVDVFFYGLIYKKLGGESIEEQIKKCRLFLSEKPKELKLFEFRIAQCSLLNN